MKAKDIKVGETFMLDNSFVRPKLKLNEGYIDMVTQYIYTNKDNIDATICTESKLNRIRQNWGWTTEKFENYKKILIKKYIKKEGK